MLPSIHSFLMVQYTGINIVLYSQWIMKYEKKIIMMWYNSKQCLIECAVLVKSAVLFLNYTPSRN